MRENPPFEVRLRRFGVRRAAVAIVASVAVAAVSAWAWSPAASRAGENVAWVFAIAAVLAAATVAAALSLARVQGGVLTSRDGCTSFAPQSGLVIAGALTIALDWGAFFLLAIAGAIASGFRCSDEVSSAIGIRCVARSICRGDQLRRPRTPFLLPNDRR